MQRFEVASSFVIVADEEFLLVGAALTFFRLLTQRRMPTTVASTDLEEREE
jgi:hypothetical protein